MEERVLGSAMLGTDQESSTAASWGGDRGFSGTLRVWFKNENHVSWLDGKPYVASPDASLRAS